LPDQPVGDLVVAARMPAPADAGEAARSGADLTHERGETCVVRVCALDRRDREPRVAADLERVGAVDGGEPQPEQDRAVLGLGGGRSADRLRAAVEHRATGR
jgi:hypothetical protein